MAPKSVTVAIGEPAARFLAAILVAVLSLASDPVQTLIVFGGRTVRCEALVTGRYRVLAAILAGFARC